MTPTVWPARRVKDRILCGRQVNGQYACTGEIAYYKRDWSATTGYSSEGTFAIPPGLVEDPDDPGMYVWSMRAQERLNRGDKAQFKQGWLRNITGHLRQTAKWVDPPFRRKCPHCRCIALVSGA